MREIEFDHAVYEQQGHVNGAYPPEQEEHYRAIRRLVKGADAALYRKDGYFFDTLDVKPRTFVFGFLTVEDIRQEAFFDLYLAPVNQVEGVSLLDIKEQLRQNSEKITNRHDPISESVTIRVARAVRHGERNHLDTASHNSATVTETETRDHPTDENHGPDSAYDSTSKGQNGADAIDSEDSVKETAKSGINDEPQREGIDQPTSPDGDADRTEHGDTNTGDTAQESNADEGAQHGETSNATIAGEGGEPNASEENAIYATPMSFTEIAKMWEQYRRSDGPVKTDLAELNRFVATVSGSISQVDYVSQVPDRGDPQYFGFIGNDCESKVDVTDLVERLEQNTALEDLHWNDLPTYEEDLQQLRSSLAEDVSNICEYETVSKKSSMWLKSTIEEELSEYHRKRAVAVFEDVVEGDLNADGDRGRFDDIRRIIKSDSRREKYEGIATGVETDTIDDELKAAIARELGAATESELKQRLELEIIRELDRTLQERINEEVETVLKQTIERVDELKSSRPYAESDTDYT